MAKSDVVVPFSAELRKPVLGVRVVSMSAEEAMAFAGFKDEPEDLGPPADIEKYKPGARVYEFKRAPRYIHGNRRKGAE